LEPQAINTTQPELEDAFVDVLGARVHYVHAGTGRPLLLIHGLTGSTGNWRRNIAAFARDASVYAIDLVNMGRSQRVTGLDAGLAATADRVAACMDALGLAEADIAAHSHGGAIALMFAARHLERVRSLILFAPANPFSNVGDPLVRLYTSAPGRQLARLVPYLPRSIYRIALGRMYGDHARIVDGTLDGYVEGLRVAGTIDHVMAIVHSWFAEMAALRAALPQVAHVPTLLVWGDRDRAVTLASGLKLHHELPESEWIVLPGAGHVAFEELPEEANRIMHDWLSRNYTVRPQAEPSRTSQPQPHAPRTAKSTLQHLSRQA
jgi:4,5:9,10-diseco-3-hydroxy-5,9,17-trioxoandrosta-1(10),2-diene-4-oate hydrolase